MAKGEATLLLKIKESGAKVLDKFVITLGDITSIAKAAGNAMLSFGKAMFDAALKASEFDQVRNAFRNLAAGQGQDADKMLVNMKKLAGGTVSNLELMKQANNALLLGLPVEKFGDMLNIARSAAKATGQSMQFMLQSITTGLGRGSKLILDNLGIVFDLNDAYKEFAATMGRTAASLSEAEKKQAFVNKALAVGKENAEKAGAGTDSLTDAMESLKANLENATIALGVKFIPAAKATLRILNLLLIATEKAFLSPTLDQQRKQLISLTARQERLKGKVEAAGRSSKDVWERELELITQRVNAVQKLVDVEDMRIQKEDAIRAASKEAKDLELAEEKERQVLGFDQRAEEIENKLLQQEEADLMLLNQQLAFINNKLLNEQDETKRRALLNRKALLVDKKQKDAQAKTDRIRDLGRSKFEKFLDNEKLKRAETTLNSLSALQQSNSKVLAGIGKAAAIINIGLDTARGAIAAYASLAGIPIVGPALGAAAAAALIAFGAEQAAKVAGINLAEGGIVSATPGGVSATIAEGGQDEAVIPLEDADQNFGTTVIINVNGGMLGTEDEAREFAEAVDEQLFLLKQDNSSLAFDQDIT